MRCYRKILCISYKDHVTNKEVLVNIQQAIWTHEGLQIIVKRCKLRWYGQVWPKPSCKAHSERGKKTRQTEEEMGRQHKGMDRPWFHQVPEGSGQQGKMEETGCKIICGAHMTFTVKGYDNDNDEIMFLNLHHALIAFLLSVSIYNFHSDLYWRGQWNLGRP